MGNISFSNVYGSASGDLTSPGSLRVGVSGEFTFTFDYTVSNLPAPDYQEPVAKSGLTYTGETQALIDGGSVKTGGVMQYALGSNSSEVPISGWDTKLPAAKDPGEYYVWYRITSGKGRGEEAKCLPAIKINKAKLTITALDRGVTLYHAAPDLSKPIENKHYIITGLVGEDKLKTEPKLEYQKNGAAVQPDTSWFATYDIVP
jgi:hypothetical protein